MEKSKIPFQSRLKAPAPVSSTSAVPRTTSKVLQPRQTNRQHHDDLSGQPPVRRALSRRSKSFSDLRTNTRPLDFTARTQALASKPLVASKSTLNLHAEAKKTTRTVLKTIPEKSSNITKTAKRTAPPAEAPVKPKVAKVAKPAPYDYKARFNLLTEKHATLVETHKHVKQQMIDAEKDLQQYTILKEEHLQLQKEFALLQSENSKNATVMREYHETISNLKSELEKLQSEHTNLIEKYHQVQSDQAQLKRTHESLVRDKNSLELKFTNSLSTIEELESNLQQFKTTLLGQEEVRRVMHNQIQDLKGTIRVFCRVRPNRTDEDFKLLCNIAYVDEDTLEIKKSKESVSCISGKPTDLKLDFSFDKVFPPEATQAEVFEELSQLVQSALDGYHICVFAYGQTGSGKTYTMQGEANDACAGMIPRTIRLIFDHIANLRKLGWTYKVEASFLEIYNETIRDLLDPEKNKHHEIRFNEGRGTTVTNLIIKPVGSAEELQYLMAVANQNRAVAVTNYNEHSSRSHAVTKITLTGENDEMKIAYVGSLSLVDLAGSESAKTSSSERIVETKNINKSLSTLGTVMAALHNKESHIPYRNSKLTYLLQSSLDGNSKTLMFVNISPFEETYGESVNSLRFAAKVKEIKISSKRNKTYLRRELSNKP